MEATPLYCSLDGVKAVGLVGVRRHPGMTPQEALREAREAKAVVRPVEAPFAEFTYAYPNQY